MKIDRMGFYCRLGAVQIANIFQSLIEKSKDKETMRAFRYVAKGYREDQITKIPLSFALVSLQDYLRFQF